MSTRFKFFQQGSTLIEVLVAIVLVGLVVTGIMLSITYSVKNSSEARYREVATELAQGGMEIVKLRREVDPWSTFYGYASNSTPRFLCWSGTALTVTTACTGGGIITNNGRVYTRYVVLSRAAGPPQSVKATVTVEWNSDSNALMNVELTQEFKERVL